MPITYTNRKGALYFLCQTIMRQNDPGGTRAAVSDLD